LSQLSADNVIVYDVVDWKQQVIMRTLSFAEAVKRQTHEHLTLGNPVQLRRMRMTVQQVIELNQEYPAGGFNPLKELISALHDQVKQLLQVAA
jgi:hypothetical protein